jgi:hypothetical protein
MQADLHQPARARTYVRAPAILSRRGRLVKMYCWPSRSGGRPEHRQHDTGTMLSVGEDLEAAAAGGDRRAEWLASPVVAGIRYGSRRTRSLAGRRELRRRLANFVTASVGKHPLPGDSWASLKPWQPVLYPTAAKFRNLSATDATLLVKFYDSLQEITDIVNSWVEDSQTTADVNAWNFLMQKVPAQSERRPKSRRKIWLLSR